MADATGPRPRLTIVVPAYNEEERLGRTLDAIDAWLGARGEPFEVIVVDDGSRDGTRRIAEERAANRADSICIALPENRGKGAAVRAGFERSRGELVLFSDADLSTPIEELDRLRGAVEDGAGLAIASRGLPQSSLEVRQAFLREQMGKAFNALVRVWTGIPFRDTQCGFKLLRGDDARAIAKEMREPGFAFDVEMILLARRRGLVVREIPVTWRNDSRSRVDPVQDSLRMLRAIPRIVARTGRYRA